MNYLNCHVLKHFFFENFIENPDSNCDNIYSTIPYLFTESFLNQKKGNKLKVCKSYLNIFNLFCNENRNEIINFTNFYSHYDNYLSNYFAELFNENNRESSSSNICQKEGIYTYKIIELNNNLLFNYIYILDNINSIELKNIFPYYRYNLIIEQKNYFSFSEKLECSFINSKMISSFDLVLISMLSLYSITSTKIDLNKKNLINSIFISIEDSFIYRKYLSLMSNIFIELFYLSKNMSDKYNLSNILSDLILPMFLLDKGIFSPEMKKNSDLMSEITEYRNKGFQTENEVKPKQILNILPLTIQKTNSNCNCPDNKVKDEILKCISEFADNVEITGVLTFMCPRCSKNLFPKIKTNDNNTYDIYSIKLLYERCHKLLLKFIDDGYNLVKLDSIKDLSINIIYYLKLFKFDDNLIDNFLDSTILN